MSDVTRILERVEQGNPTAAEELLPLVRAAEGIAQLQCPLLARERSPYFQ